MTDRITPAVLSVRTTAPRMTPIPAGRRFAEALAEGGRALLTGAVSAVSFIPGAHALAATVRGAIPGSAPMMGGGVGGTAEGPGAGPAASSGASPSTGGDPTGDDMLTRGQEMSLRFLRLQEAMGEENRRYTALSNVLHARHEMAKNAIGNIR